MVGTGPLGHTETIRRTGGRWEVTGSKLLEMYWNKTRRFGQYFPRGFVFVHAKTDKMETNASANMAALLVAKLTSFRRIRKQFLGFPDIVRKEPLNSRS
jgi:hypothetical protein